MESEYNLPKDKAPEGCEPFEGVSMWGEFYLIPIEHRPRVYCLSKQRAFKTLFRLRLAVDFPPVPTYLVPDDK